MSIISEVQDRDIQGFELEDKIHDGENVVGCFYKNTGLVNLINIHKQYDSYKGKDINIEDFGKWHIEDITPQQEKINIQLKLFDLSYKFDEEYDPSIITFPCTNIEWAEAVCNKVGVEFGSTAFPNSSLVLEEQPYLPDKATYRDVIKMISQSAGCYAKVDRDNKLYIRWFEDTTVEIDDFFELSQEPETESINMIVLGRGSVEDNIEFPIQKPENPKELRIDDNQILYFKREEGIVPIYNQIVGFKFYPFKMRTYGLPDLKAGMKVKYHDIDGLEVETYVMYHKIVFNGGTGENKSYSSNIESYELKETSTKHQYAGTIEKRVTNTERICDKNSNEIKDIVEQQQGIKTQTNVITQTLENTTLKIENIENETNSKVEKLEQRIDGLSNQLTESGGNNIFYYSTEFWQEVEEETGINLLEYSDTEIKNNSISGRGYIVNSGAAKQKADVQNGIYAISFKYKKIGNELTNTYVKINGKSYELNSDTWTTFEEFLEVNANYIEIEFEADADDVLYVTDLTGNFGSKAERWTQNPNETRTDTVSIGKGIKVESSETNTYTTIDSDGNRTFNKATGERVAEMTDKGVYSKEIECEGQAQIAGLLFKQVGNQTWVSSLL